MTLAIYRALRAIGTLGFDGSLLVFAVAVACLESKNHMNERPGARYDPPDTSRVTTSEYTVVKEYMNNRAPVKQRCRSGDRQSPGGITRRWISLRLSQKIDAISGRRVRQPRTRCGKGRALCRFVLQRTRRSDSR